MTAAANGPVSNLSWANGMSVARIALAVPTVICLTSGSQTALILAVCLMLLSEITDVFDGVVARRLKQITPLGKVLDPLADSLYRISVFLAFVYNDWMSVWLLLCFLIRDIVVSNLRTIAQIRGHTMAARLTGKLKAIAQAAAQIVVAATYAIGANGRSQVWDTFNDALLVLAAGVTLLSLFDYLMGTFKTREG